LIDGEKSNRTAGRTSVSDPERLQMIHGKSWPYQEARKVVDELAARPALDGAPVLFETGFGPSGLPHIGTFAEVNRTTFVRKAFEWTTGLRGKLIAFSDDMDGLRKVPLNLPNRERTREHLGRPLSEIPDPFGEQDSFSGYMNAKLRSFLDRFGFEYEFRSSTEQYRSGVFDEGLLRILERYDAVRGVILPTLGEENRDEWSPFLPLCSGCRRYTTRVLTVHPERGALTYRCDRPWGKGENLAEGCGHGEETPVTGGRVKVGWKVDWALRWLVLGIHYEMYGKDLIESARLSGQIVRILGGRPPAGFFYEMFLDESGEKISKSVGQGLTVDKWLEYATLESLSHWLFYNPKQARRLHVGVIPAEVDAYLKDLRAYPKLAEEQKPDSPVRFIHAGQVPEPWGGSITFNLVQNLVAALSTEDEALILDFLKRYEPAVAENPGPVLELVRGAVAYYRDHLAHLRQRRLPAEAELAPLEHLASLLEGAEGKSAEDLQALAFDTTRSFELEQRAFFQACYEVLLGFERGPRLGTFCALVGPGRVAADLREACERVKGQRGAQDPH
jgi:lysyl-tRNA synthetase, class I